ncbi:MAG: carboxylating nicotinate-nucleotide diphosphorylase [Candidatus Margulisiibacteriota bacterium]
MEIIELVKATLHEDIQNGDITSNLLLDASPSEAAIIAKAEGVFFGMPILNALKELYPGLIFKMHCRDGDGILVGDSCCEIQGSAKDIVVIERTLLNFLQRLCGIATTTQQFVRALGDPNIQVLDTRKTTPLLRSLEKQAVVAGGGFNHRQGLYDMVLVKENHLFSYIQTHGIDSFNQLLRDYKIKFPTISIEVEVNDFNHLNLLDFSVIDIVMFDNMNMDLLLKCIAFVNELPSKPLKEVSGNVSLDSIHQYRGIDIDRISVGSLTHSVKAMDLSLLLK